MLLTTASESGAFRYLSLATERRKKGRKTDTHRQACVSSLEPLYRLS